MISKAPKVTVCLTIDKDVWVNARKLAAEKDLSASHLIRIFLKNWVKEQIKIKLLEREVSLEKIK